MNRKAIKEFSEQAKQHALNYMIKIKLTERAQASRAYSEKYETKFAELIVKECLDIVDDEGCGEGGSIRAINKIKQHFGVEE